MMKYLGRFGWLISGGLALVLSAYSLHYVFTYNGMPNLLAWAFSPALDGAALVLADQGLKVSRTPDGNTFSYRVLTAIIACLSAWINFSHGSIMHSGLPVKVGFAALPIIALVLFDKHLGIENRKAQIKSGRIQSPLPRIRPISWYLHPIVAYKTLRTMAELDNERYGITVEKAIEKAGQNSTETRANPREVRAWADSKGIEVKATGVIPAKVYEMHALEMSNGSSNGASNHNGRDN